MKSFGLTDKGCVRKENQDCFLIRKCETNDCLIVALCDGMGGAKAGATASELAVKAFVEHVTLNLKAKSGKKRDPKKLLSDAAAQANTHTYDFSRLEASFNGMGTTLVGGVIGRDGSVSLVNVGDSRAYNISAGGKTVYQITRDHSLVEELVACGIISREAAANHPQKNVITRAVGTEPDVKSDYYELKLEYGDMLLLCSDGLSNIMTEMELLDYAVEYKEPELICRALLSKALLRGARDNVTIIAVVR